MNLPLSHNSTLLLRPRADVDPNLVGFFVSEFLKAQSCNVALLAMLVYHSIITMDKEVKYFWTGQWNTVRIVYFTNRYIGLLGDITSVTRKNKKRIRFARELTSCLRTRSARNSVQLYASSYSYVIIAFKLKINQGLFSFWVGSVSTLITMVLIHYILLIRVSALYQNKRLDILLKSLLSLDAIAGLTILIYGNQVEQYTVGELAEGLMVCGYNGTPQTNLAIASWTIPLAFGSLLAILALPKAAEYWKLSFGFKGLHLVGVLVRDQLVYYGFVILFCVLKIVELSVPNIDMNVSYFLGIVANPTMLCLLGGQILINMKEAAERGANAGTSYVPSVGSIEFA